MSAKINKGPTRAETLLIRQMVAWKLPKFEKEYRFIPDRRFRADFAWPDKKVALEIEGGSWVGGRHTRGPGYERDCEKYSLAAINGWRVIRVTPAMIKRGQAIELIRQALNVETAT